MASPSISKSEPVTASLKSLNSLLELIVSSTEMSRLLRAGASLIFRTLMVDVSLVDSASPSLIAQVIVRSVLDGLSEELAYMIDSSELSY